MRNNAFRFGPLWIGMICLFTCTAYADLNPFKKKGDEDKAKESEKVRSDAEEAMKNFKKADPGMEKLFKESTGYAVFPTVAKGGIGIGGAFGKGVVYEKGKHIGATSLKQASIGFQLGGQTYSEIIFFENERALNDFKTGNFEFSAQVSAVAASAGVSADSSFDNGLLVFTIAKAGLMYEATVAGQKFTFESIEKE